MFRRMKKQASALLVIVLVLGAVFMSAPPSVYAVPPPTNISLNNNADLSTLTLSSGTLSPAFASSTMSYTSSVPNSVSSLTVTASSADLMATIRVNGTEVISGQESGAIDLNVGSNTITVEVTAEDLTTTKTYTIIVTRDASNNADLSALTLSSSTLSPGFSSAEISYTASVENSVSSVTVTASVYDSNATMTVSLNNGTADALMDEQASGPLDLNVGENTIEVVVTAQDGTTTKTYTITVTRAAATSSGGGGGGPTGGTDEADQTDQNETDLIVTIDGETQEAIATATTSEQDGQTVLTVTMDTAKLSKQLEKAGDKQVVTIPVTASADKVAAVLTGEAVKALENKNTILEVQTPIGSYKLPASEVLIDQLSEQLGAGTELANITLHVDIAKSDNAKVELLANAADKGKFTVVVPPVDFTVAAEFDNKKVQVTKFNSFVEREIPLPEGADASEISTAVVLNEDGTTRSVPTKVVTRDGVTYVVVNSLTNNTYSVVWNPVEFEDVEQHWSKDAVNDMGSRMVISGVENGMFNPYHDITRAEFAAIIVRGLGLELESGSAPFSDVKESSWYNDVIKTAHANNLINGYKDGTFRPNNKITREQAMVIISKAMAITKLSDQLSNSSTETTLRPYQDVNEISAWALHGITDTVKADIVSGRSATELAPKDNMTRAEVAVIIERLLRKSNLI